ncbi:MAG: choice-of-anchor D domain-containing protein, partial [Calditrichaeota bacterium]
QPVQFSTGDFNNDGFPDVAVINSTSNTLTIIRNATPILQNIFLETFQTYSTGTTPLDVQSADFDRDGNLDLVVVNYFSDNIGIYWGNGDYTFSTPTTIQVGFQPTSLEAGDFDGDGLLDIAVCVSAQDRVTILKNNGNRQFVTGDELTTGSGPFAISSGDFDRDGDMDLATANNGSQTISIFQNLNQQGWNLLQEVSINQRPVDIRWENVHQTTLSQTSDPYPELIVLGSSLTILGKRNTPLTNENSELYIFEWDSTLSNFSLIQNIPVEGAVSHFSLLNPDFDRLQNQLHDLDLDLLLTNYTGGTVQLLANQQNEGWETPLIDLLPAENPRVSISVDFDRDGDEDILFAEHFSDTLSLIITPPELFDPPNDGLIIDFGDVFVGDTLGADVPFVLENTLTVNVLLTVQDTDNFDAIPTQFTLSNGIPQIVEFQFHPQDTLSYETITLVDTDHPLNNNPGTIIMRGRGVIANIAVEPLILDFGIVPPGFTNTLDLQITNNGNGSLRINEWLNSLPQFETPQLPAEIAPHSSSTFSITFAPDTLGIFRDTLHILSNASNTPDVPVILLGESSGGKPQITSPDTVTAIEHQFFSYQVTAVDPENHPLTFFFFNLANWMQVRTDSVFGIPPEGATDTQFRIIASDGYLRDTLDVYVIVIPVNDPPVFTPVDTQVVEELQTLSLTIEAIDPENEPLLLEAFQLPAGATFNQQNPTTAQFRWQPPLGSAGNYTVIFRASETVSTPPLADTLQLFITVTPKKPDLEAINLTVDPTTVHLNQQSVITAEFINREAPVTEPFKLRLQVDDITVFDTTITNLQIDESVLIRSTPQLTRLGELTVKASADPDNLIQEADETNNILSQTVTVIPGNLIVRPNPFTPNGDTKNDRAGFDMRELNLSTPMLVIYDIRGRKIRELRNISNEKFFWDGRDENGEDTLPGVYLYVLKDGSKQVAKGYVVVAR